MRREGGRWTLLLHIYRAIWDHECPHTCSCSLQVTPGVMQRHSPTPWRKWDIGFPRENVSSSKCLLFFWAAVSLKVRLTFKGFGPLTVGAGMVGTVGKLWLGHRLCSSQGRYGSASEIRHAWQSHCCRSTHRKWGVANKPFQQFPWSKKSDKAKFQSYLKLTLSLCLHFINADTSYNEAFSWCTCKTKPVCFWLSNCVALCMRIKC